MSCRAQIVKRKAPFWSGAAFSPLPFGWCCGFLRLFGGVDFTSFLGVALLYWSSFFGVVLLSNFLLLGGVAFPVPFWVVSRFPPPLGWCWRFLLILGGVAFPSSIIMSGAAVSSSSFGWCWFPPSSRQHYPLFSVTLIHCAHDMTCLESADCLKIHFIWIDEMWIGFTLIEWTKKILMKKKESY